MSVVHTVYTPYLCPGNSYIHRAYNGFRLEWEKCMRVSVYYMYNMWIYVYVVDEPVFLCEALHRHAYSRSKNVIIKQQNVPSVGERNRSKYIYVRITKNNSQYFKRYSKNIYGVAYVFTRVFVQSNRRSRVLFDVLRSVYTAYATWSVWQTKCVLSQRVQFIRPPYAVWIPDFCTNASTGRIVVLNVSKRRFSVTINQSERGKNYFGLSMIGGRLLDEK